MTRFLIILAAISLTACTKTVSVEPVPVAMPSLPAPLNETAKPLPPITGTDLHSLLRDGIAADRAYNELRDRHNAIIQAWECVRLSLRDGTDTDQCFSH